MRCIRSGLVSTLAGAAGLLILLLASLSIAQEVVDPATGDEDPVAIEEENASAQNPPQFIRDLLNGSELTADQVNQMRAEGYGWGNIKISAELAEKISSQSEGTETPILFSDALKLVMDARAQDIGFGEIAAKYGLKVGELNRNQVQMAGVKGAGIEKPVKAEKMEKHERPEKPEKPERPEKHERPEKPERGPQR